MVVVALLVPEVDLDTLQLRLQCFGHTVDIHEQSTPLNLRDSSPFHLIRLGLKLFELKAQLHDLLILEFDQLLLFIQLFLQIIKHLVFFFSR